MTNRTPKNGTTPATRKTMRTALTTLALAGATAVPMGAFAATASAHDELTGTTPSTGSTVTSAPSSIDLRFSEKPLEVGNQIAVKAPDGSTTKATPTVNGTVVRAPFAAHGNGLYTVTWRVVSDDGHPVSGTFTFTVKGAASSASSPSASASSAAASATTSTAPPSSAATSTPAASSPTATSTFAPSSPSAASAAHTKNDGGAAWGVIGAAGAVVAAVVLGVALMARRRRG